MAPRLKNQSDRGVGMTGRQRVSAILHKRPADRLCWAPLVDGHTLGELPPPLRGTSELDFYRHLGSDILVLGGYEGSVVRLASPALVWPAEVRLETRQAGEERTIQWRTPWGRLTQVRRRGHPVKFPVASLADLKIYRSMWEGASYEARDDRAACKAADDALGQDGVLTRFWGPSTIPMLLEEVMGTEAFYYLLADHPADMEALFAVIHGRELRAFELLAAGPWEAAILCENTSTYYLSPDVYRRHSGPHVRDFVAAMHAAGKPALVHMCGHVRNILDLISQTGLDGIHALTPPPTGDTPWELALDALGEDLVIIGVLDPTIFISGPLRDIGPALSRLITPRVRRSNFILGTFADGLAVPLERFQAVAAWVEQNGGRS